MSLVSNTTEEITESNFNQYFHDTRKFPPKPGQVLARFTAYAELMDDWVKRNMVALLLGNRKGAESVMRLMKNMIGAIERDGIRVPLEMARDLAGGMTREQVYEKPYEFYLEKFWWTTWDCVPLDDPHWSVIEVKDTRVETSESIG